MADSRPNILLITTDQQRADALGMENPAVQTPHMDALAERGVAFTRSYTNCPLCSPARVSWITGRYPHNHGTIGNGICPLPQEQERTWANGLRGAGYRTAFIGKHHFFNVKPGDDSRKYDERVQAFGFDHVHQVSGKGASATYACNFTADLEAKGSLEQHVERYKDLGGTPTDLATLARVAGPAALDEDDYIDTYTGRRGVEWLRANREEPFSLHLSFSGPHSPFDGPGRFAEMYDADQMDLPPSYWDTLEGKPAYQHERQVAPPENAEAQRLARQARALYYANTSLIDHWVGQAVAAVKENGQAEHTAIIFTSDHGEMLGEHGAYSKTLFYEASARVPFIVSWPDRFAAGRRSDALVESVDVYRTITGLAGIPTPHGVFGHSLLPILEGAADRVRDAAFSELRTKTMVRMDDWKLVYDPAGDGAEELYNLADDPHELDNRVGDGSVRSTLEQLKTALLDWAIQTQAPLRMAH